MSSYFIVTCSLEIIMIGSFFTALIFFPSVYFASLSFGREFSLPVGVGAVLLDEDVLRDLNVFWVTDNLTFIGLGPAQFPSLVIEGNTGFIFLVVTKLSQ